MKPYVSKRIKAENKFLDNITLSMALEKLGCKKGKMRFPCFFPKIKSKGFDRYLEYHVFNSLFDPFHKCTIMLYNLFWNEMQNFEKGNLI